MPDGPAVRPRKAKRIAARQTRKRGPKQVINAVDLFCGAGGTSTGLLMAAQDLGYETNLIAINHWEVAIATHSRNHGDVTHYCQSIDTLDPLKIIPDGRLQLLVASPECIHHSNARGGKPRSDQKRADAWMLIRWIDKLYVENILIENVPEFRDWGPLTAKGQPDKRHKGKYFQQFIDTLSINYSVEYRVLNCADYGDPTTRKRLFIMCRRGHKKIVWPTRTHASRKELALLATNPERFGVEADAMKDLVPWVSAKEIIDWSLEGTSIFGRKKPLSENTLNRIFKGLWRYSLEPFIVPQRTENAPRDVVQFHGGKDGDDRAYPADDPIKTIDTSNRYGVADGFFFNMAHTTNDDGSMVKDLDTTMPTIAGKGMFGFVEAIPFPLPPYLIKNYSGHDASRSKSVDDPVGSITANFNHDYLVEPVLVNMKGQSTARDVNEPTYGQTTKDHQGLATAYIVKFYGNGDNVDSTEDPLATVTGRDRFGLVESEIVDGENKSRYEPKPGEMGLYLPSLNIIVFIRFRMLQPHELAAAMSFPADYEFTGNRENKVKQIGNAVPLKTAKALCGVLLGP